MTIPTGVREVANYVTCPKGHKLFVIWSPQFKKYAFTCDECREHSVHGWSPVTGHIIDVRIVRKLKPNERPV